jgi:hypothetical protein
MQDPQNIALRFDARTLDYLVNVLAQRPYAEAAPVIDNIRQQVAQAQEIQPVRVPQQEKSPISGQDGAVGLLNGAGDGVGANGAAAAS